MQVEFRGRKYKASPFEGIKILPFAKALGLITESGEFPDFQNAAEAERQDMARAMIRSLAEPGNHHRVAYSLKQMIPELPPESCNYQIMIHESGMSEAKVTLDLHQEELFSLLEQLQRKPQAPAEPEKPAESAIAVVVGNERKTPPGTGFSPGVLAALQEQGVDLSPLGL